MGTLVGLGGSENFNTSKVYSKNYFIPCIVVVSLLLLL